MSFQENSSVAFKQLLADVEHNMDSLEKSGELFENYLAEVTTHPSLISERLELAMVLLCAGRYQESYNIIRKIDLDTSQEFWMGKSAPSSSNSDETSKDEDVLEDVEWLLPQLNQPATSPYQ